MREGTDLKGAQYTQRETWLFLYPVKPLRSICWVFPGVSELLRGCVDCWDISLFFFPCSLI